MSLPGNNRTRVVFLDRDGVINENRDDYVKNTDEFCFLPGSLDALRRLHAAGFKAVVISNQACIGKGLLTKEALASIDRLMFSQVRKAGGEIAATYYCYHRPEDKCDCRKPAPGLILRAGRDMKIDIEDTVFIGDNAKDVQAGQAAGCRTVLVLSGMVSASVASAIDPAPDLVAADLSEAVDRIIAGEV
ncbi:MAG: D-glycero-beta-D-manno-heptose 1,7-bisphosphate 7-phosphatase [Armatimonadota bacterium]